MSQADYAEYAAYFLASSSSVIRYECLEITHSHFSQEYRVVRNATRGLTVTHENGQQYSYEYYPLEIENLGASDDLDVGYSIRLGDTGDIIWKEIERVLFNDAILEKPRVVYRAYRSDNLAKPLDGPNNLEMKDVTCAVEGATFEAKAPLVNVHGTGEAYTPDRFPLRGFLY